MVSSGDIRVEKSKEQSQVISFPNNLRVVEFHIPLFSKYWKAKISPLSNIVEKTLSKKLMKNNPQQKIFVEKTLSKNLIEKESSPNLVKKPCWMNLDKKTPLWCVLSTPFAVPFHLPVLFLNEYSSGVNFKYPFGQFVF